MKMNTKTKHSWLKLLLLALFCILTTHQADAATQLTPQHLYAWAKQHNTNRLNQFQRYINLKDQNQNTALCLAQKNHDKNAYNLLLQYGASTKVSCHDNADPICAVITGERYKICPTAFWIIGGAAAAAGIYALLENDGGHKHRQCPAGYTRGLKDCSKKAHPDAWIYHSVSDAKGRICGYCEPKTCEIYPGSVTDISGCNETTYTDATLIEVGYAGNDTCYNCSYACKPEYYTDETTCKGTGYQCSKIEENGQTCYIRGVPEQCPTDHPSEIACTPTDTGWRTIEDIVIVGDRPCYACEYQCDAPTWISGHCPEGRNCIEKQIPDGSICHFDEGCPTTPGTSYTTKEECEEANPGYTCTENTTGSGCWYKDEPTTCPNPEYQKFVLADCGDQVENGWYLTYDGNYSGDRACAKCNERLCSENGEGYATTNTEENCPDKTSSYLKKLNSTVGSVHHGQEPCYKCEYGCLYSSIADCENKNDGYTCTLVETEIGNCPVPTGSKDCPVDYPFKDNCPANGNGYIYTEGESITVGDNTCLKCSPSCATDWIAGTCPEGKSCEDYILTPVECYLNPTCPTTAPYTSKEECEEANPGYTCVENVTGSGCWKKGGDAACPDPEYQKFELSDCGNQGENGWYLTYDGNHSGDKACAKCNERLCSENGAGYATDNTEENCPDKTSSYLKKLNSTEGSIHYGDEACYKCEYGCLYSSVTDCENKNEGYTCTLVETEIGNCPVPTGSKDCPVDYPYVSSCPANGNGYIYTEGESITVGDNTCLKCTPSCATDWDEGSCPVGKTCEDEITTPVDCYINPTCPTTAPYTSKESCEEANPGYTCVENVAGSGCWKKDGDATCPNPEYQKFELSDCGDQGENGWFLTYDGNYSGTKACAKCNERPCSDNGAGYATTNTEANCPDKKSSHLKKLNSTEGSIHYGEESCYKCEYGCLYSSITDCETKNEGYTCTMVSTEIGECPAPTGSKDCPVEYPYLDNCPADGTGYIYTEAGSITVGDNTCLKCSPSCAVDWIEGSCPAGKTCENYIYTPVECYLNPTCPSTAPYTSKEDCEDANPGYTCTENVNDSGCWKKGGDAACPDPEYQILDISSCGNQVENGWYLTYDGNYSGTKQCAKCNKRSCSDNGPDYDTTNTEANCPDKTSSYLKKLNSTEGSVHYGQEACYKCEYGCLYSSITDCETKNEGYTCTMVSTEIGECPAPTGSKDCPIDYPYLDNCPANGNGYKYSQTGSTTVGDNTCVACSLSCATGWTGGSCPTGKTCEGEISTPIACYINPTCPSDAPYTSSTACLAANPGYTCTENVSGSGCWQKGGDAACPNPEYQILYISSCGDKLENGWFLTYDGNYSGTEQCAKCNKRPCSDNGEGYATTNTQANCPDKTSSHLKKKASLAGTYFYGQETCYKCQYECLYTSTSNCETANPGYNCTMVTTEIGSCPAPTSSKDCSGDYPYLDNCPANGTGYKYTQTDSTTVGDNTCVACSLSCANGWTAGNCPSGKTCENAISTPIACYLNPSCPSTAPYTSSAACLTANPGYTCVENVTGSGCWQKGGDAACPDPEYQILDVDNCGNQGENGWKLINDPAGHKSGTKTCSKCSKRPCSDNGAGYATTNTETNCPDKTSSHLKKLNSTEGSVHYGDEACYKCEYGCLYSSTSDCENKNEGYICTNVTTEIGSCPAPTSSKDCSGAYPYLNSCPTNGTGYKYSQTGSTTVGDNTCVACSLSCATGWTGGSCPTGKTCEGEISTPIACYLNPTCPSTAPYTSSTACLTANTGYTCTENVSGSGCWQKGNALACTNGDYTVTNISSCGDKLGNGWFLTYDGNYSGTEQCAKCNKRPCSDNGEGYATTNTQANCPDKTSSHLKKKASLAGTYFYGQETCYKCQYECLYTSTANCETANPGYNCTMVSTEIGNCPAPTSSKDCSGDYPYLDNCPANGTGYKYTQTDSTTVGDNTCVACSLSCANGWTAGTCPSGKTCENAISTPIACYLNPSCPSTAPYTSSAACLTANPGYTCVENVTGSGCWQKGGDAACPDPEYQILEVDNCGNQGENGWYLINDPAGHKSGTKTCSKCIAKQCEANGQYYTTAQTTCSSLPDMTNVDQHTGSIHNGEKTCYWCEYACKYQNTTTGKNSCEDKYGEGECKLITYQGNSCWVHSSNSYASHSTNMTVFNTIKRNIMSTGNEDVYGIISSSNIKNMTDANEAGSINIEHNSTGRAIGLYGTSSNTISNLTGASINIRNNSSAQAIGIYASEGGQAINEGTIKIEGNGGTAIGIYGEGNNHIVNAKSGIIDVSAENAYGIYVNNGTGSLVENAGTIYASGTNAHGIYINKNASDSTVLNTGSIYLNGAEVGNAGITLNGSSLRNASLLKSDSLLNLDSMGGRIYLEDGGVYEAESIEGNLIAGTSNVLGSNLDTYVNEGALQSDDINNLSLSSESALFEASTKANNNGGNDVVLERKGFAEFTPNSSIAQYLEQNYEQGNLEEMYDNVKAQTSASGAQLKLAKDLGYDTLPNFADENYAALKSLNRNIADTILEPTDEVNRVVAGADNVSLATKNESVLSGYDLNATSMYTFGDKRLDNDNRLGLGLSITRLSSDYDRGGDRDLNIFNIFVPYLHNLTNNLRLASILSAGYGYGEYDRGSNRESDIKDYFYGWTNELRYTMDLNGFAELEPALMLNAIGYTEDGFDEGHGTDAITTKKTHNMSVESGVGLFLKKKVSLAEYGKLGFKIGGAYYRELGTPYDTIEAHHKRGATGWYKMNDYANIYNHDRALIEAAIDYDYRSLSLYAKYNQTLLKHNKPKYFDLGIKYHF